MEIFATMDINAITTWLIELFSIGALILFLLTAAVNIIVEVFKGLAPKLPTNIMAWPSYLPAWRWLSPAP